MRALDEKSVNCDEVFVGQKGKDFSFEDIRSMKVDFIECSAKGNDDNDLKDLQLWLHNII